MRPKSRGPVKNERLSAAIAEVWQRPGFRERNVAGGRAARAARAPKATATSRRGRAQQVEREARDNRFRALLSGLLAHPPRGLSGHQREVLTLRFGLDGGPCRTLEDVGRHFGTTRSAVQQSESRALARLGWPREMRLVVSRTGPAGKKNDHAKNDHAKNDHAKNDHAKNDHVKND